jgi:hypothetical protein
MFNPIIHDRVKEEVEWLLDTGFIQPYRYAEWVSNLVPMEKTNTAKIGVCIDLRNLNKATPKEEYLMVMLVIIETKWSVSWFDCDESLTWQDLNSNPGQFWLFYFYLCSFGESCLLVSWCAGDRCGMAFSYKDRGKSRRLGAEDQRWSHRSGT